MKQEIKITVPTNWSAVTLRQYLAMQKDIKVYGEDENGYVACLMHHLCGFDVKYLKSLDTDTFTKIKTDLLGFIGDTELPLQREIKLDGKDYGFEPNLSKIAYGAYLDIAKYDTFTIDDNWANIMSILYRPIVKKAHGMYQIKDYDGNINGDKFLDTTMDIHFGALFFFVRLLMGLPSVILKSTMESAEIPHNIKSILAESGEITNLLSNLPMVTLEEWKM